MKLPTFNINQIPDNKAIISDGSGDIAQDIRLFIMRPIVRTIYAVANTEKNDAIPPPPGKTRTAYKAINPAQSSCTIFIALILIRAI
jgi:hypothetical protein